MYEYIPKALEWVYVYKGETTGTVSYVGRSKNADRCALRIADHRRDAWFKDEQWVIYFIACANRAESEAVETELIYRYQPKGNKEKKTWGHLIDDIYPLEDNFNAPEIMLRDAQGLKADLKRIEKWVIEQIERKVGEDGTHKGQLPLQNS